MLWLILFGAILRCNIATSPTVYIVLGVQESWYEKCCKREFNQAELLEDNKKLTLTLLLCFLYDFHHTLVWLTVRTAASGTHRAKSFKLNDFKFTLSLLRIVYVACRVPIDFHTCLWKWIKKGFFIRIFPTLKSSGNLLRKKVSWKRAVVWSNKLCGHAEKRQLVPVVAQVKSRYLSISKFQTDFEKSRQIWSYKPDHERACVWTPWSLIWKWFYAIHNHFMALGRAMKRLVDFLLGVELLTKRNNKWPSNMPLNYVPIKEVKVSKVARLAGCSMKMHSEKKPWSADLFLNVFFMKGRAKQRRKSTMMMSQKWEDARPSRFFFLTLGHYERIF